MILNKKIFIYIISYLAIFIFCTAIVVKAQSIDVDASKLVSHPEIFFSPRSASFTEGSTFEVPILVNTKGQSINGIEIRLNFDKDKLSIIKPSSGASIIGVWVEPPKYDNVRGTASYVGVVPNGIVTASGLVGTITFKAINTGHATVNVSSASNLLLNDGLGTEISYNTIKAEYTIIPKAPEGLKVYSVTHPFQGDWYKNNSPVLSWESDGTVDGYSYVLDNKPDTIPGSSIMTKESTKSFENLSDGLWYFHIKANKNGVWGTTGHFLVRIDTVPPALFKPESNYVVAAAVLVERTLISFFTTDNLSGVDHYEVGVIDKNQPITESPVFVESESPYQVPLKAGSNLRVIVRAVDKAGNIRDVSIDVKPPLLVTKIIKDYLVYILLFIILAGLAGLIIHYLFGHHIIRHINEFRKLLREEEGEKHVSEHKDSETTEKKDTSSTPVVEKKNEIMKVD